MSVRRILSVGVIAMAALALPCAAQAPATTSAPASADPQKLQVGQTPQHFEGKADGKPASVNYLLFLPAEYGKDPAKKWPVMIFLHGSGERGDDLKQVEKHGPPKNVQTDPDFPFIVVSPQCPNGVWWQLPVLNMLLDHVLATTQSDAARVYLTGLSMGGYGTWAWAEQQPERFAAIVPMCGGGNPDKAATLKEMPIWVFHGEVDPAVPYQLDVKMVEALKDAGNTTLQFTHYPGVGHDCWTASYANPKLYEWLLQQHRPAGSATTAPSTPPAH